ncbi:MAG: C39 family peptidase, partial [Phycisphaerales bacterium]|nr:C39 family peptidase [Phycisphaerales bacterium]
KSHDIYGNWPRNVQAAFELGARGFVTRYSSWSQVEQTLARGIPIVVSIRVKPGELRGAPYPKTDGHLIVIEGLDENGDVLVLDPASPDEKTGTLTYLRADMTKVWFGGSDGTSYVLIPR